MYLHWGSHLPERDFFFLSTRHSSGLLHLPSLSPFIPCSDSGSFTPPEIFHVLCFSLLVILVGRPFCLSLVVEAVNLADLLWTGSCGFQKALVLSRGDGEGPVLWPVQCPSEQLHGLAGVMSALGHHGNF